MSDNNLMTLTAEIVASHVANNRVSPADVPTLIAGTYDALAGLGKAAIEPTFEPAVSVRKSLSDPDRLLSMIDGKPYSSLKRHLKTHGLTPASYRDRYGLKADYPMVAPGYSAARRDISMKMGLGRKKATEPGTASASPNPSSAPNAKPRSRPKLKLSGPAALAKARRGSSLQQAQDEIGQPAGAEPQTDA